MKPTMPNQIHPAALHSRRVLPFALTPTIVALIAAAALSAVGEDLPYVSGSTGADGPFMFATPFSPGRYSAAMAFDPTRQLAIMFGGYVTTGDTWGWNGAAWTNLNPSNAPSPRYLHAVAYDEARSRLVLYGGITAGILSDTWLWTGQTWIQASPAQSPGVRYGHAMAYDPLRQQVVLFGGNSNGPYQNDTWTWDGTNWTLQTPASRPPARTNHQLVYDAERDRIVMFGGGYFDTWLWDGTNWTQATPLNFPSARSDTAMAYDPVRKRVVMFGGSAGSSETWLWDGSNWTIANPINVPPSRFAAAMTWDPVRQLVVMAGGRSGGTNLNDAWIWDGTNWSLVASNTVEIDMRTKPDGTWNFTTINIPAAITVTFKNAGPTPVKWLATGNVNIAGTLNLNGADGISTLQPGGEALGGPGGFPGGLGAVRFNVSGKYAGAPGAGPGGGSPGIAQNENGQAGTNTGNIYGQPLVGGSGGGGGGSGSNNDGGNGGGGGGAILIESSGDIAITGAITATGGSGIGFGNSFGGNGAGGTIRLVGDRVTGNGTISAGGTGRARLEAYYRSFIGGIIGQSAQSAPVAAPAQVANGILNVTSVAGSNVTQPPTGNTNTPDVVFNTPGTATITVTATGIPDGTPVKLRIAMPGAIINLPTAGNPAVVLAGGTAQFTATVPAGVGTIQATAEYTVP